jgi:hypothetical protein
MSVNEQKLIDDLKTLDGDYAAIAIQEDTGPVPDGKWAGRIEHGILKRATSQDPMIEWAITVTTEGPQSGKKVVVRWVINRNTLDWIKKALRAVGFNKDNVSAVADYLPKLQGALLDFAIKTKEERRTVYFNRLLNESGRGEGEGENVTVIDDFPI